MFSSKPSGPPIKYSAQWIADRITLPPITRHPYQAVIDLGLPPYEDWIRKKTGEIVDPGTGIILNPKELTIDFGFLQDEVWVIKGTGIRVDFEEYASSQIEKIKWDVYRNRQLVWVSAGTMMRVDPEFNHAKKEIVPFSALGQKRPAPQAEIYGAAVVPEIGFFASQKSEKLQRNGEQVSNRLKK